MLAEGLEIVAVIELVHWRESVRGKFGGVNPRSSAISENKKGGAEAPP